MALRRYEPFGMLDLFDLVRMPEVWPHLTTDPMRVEEFMDGTTFVVRAELPGLDPEKDVELTVEDGLLRIKAERREEKTVEKGKTYRSEFRYGTLFRAIPLPSGTAADDVKATYADGVLEVRVPVATPQAKATSIPITTV